MSMINLVMKGINIPPLDNFINFQFPFNGGGIFVLKLELYFYNINQ